VQTEKVILGILQSAFFVADGVLGAVDELVDVIDHISFNLSAIASLVNQNGGIGITLDDGAFHPEKSAHLHANEVRTDKNNTSVNILRLTLAVCRKL
jgi:hypothetical protein